MAFDLRGSGTGLFLNYLSQVGRVHGLQAGNALFTDCWPDMGDMRPPPGTWAQQVSIEDWNDVAQRAEALLRDGVAPLRYRPRREDGSTLLVEFCWRGRYGLFLRADTNLADAGDARVIAFADRLFLLGGGRSHLDY